MFAATSELIVQQTKNYFYQNKKSPNPKVAILAQLCLFSQACRNCRFQELNSRKFEKENTWSTSQGWAWKFYKYSRSIELFKRYKMPILFNFYRHCSMKKSEKTVFYLGKLVLLYVLNILFLIFRLTFNRKTCNTNLVENWMADLLKKNSSLENKKWRSYWGNTERLISPGAPVIISYILHSSKLPSIRYFC